jgi:hypothetical protein
LVNVDHALAFEKCWQHELGIHLAQQLGTSSVAEVRNSFDHFVPQTHVTVKHFPDIVVGDLDTIVIKHTSPNIFGFGEALLGRKMSFCPLDNCPKLFCTHLLFLECLGSSGGVAAEILHRPLDKLDLDIVKLSCFLVTVLVDGYRPNDFVHIHRQKLRTAASFTFAKDFGLHDLG